MASKSLEKLDDKDSNDVVPDEEDEIQDLLNNEDIEFIDGLNVVDAWEGDTEEKTLDASPGNKSESKEGDSKRNSKDRSRRDRRSSHSRREDAKSREERRREESRRDPSKSNKDIERDKARMKRDNESKILAEKEKAIKNLLDSDNVVPPGTETEALQSINSEKRNQEKEPAEQSIVRPRYEQRTTKVSPKRRPSRSPRVSPYRRRGLLVTPERKRTRLSPERRRSPPARIPPERRPGQRTRSRSLERARRLSYERRLERRRGVERYKLSGRRSRSRSIERSRRYSRSPDRPSRRSRTRSRSPEHRRKRSPFINEIVRQFRNEGLNASASGYPIPAANPTPLMNQPLNHQFMPQEMRRISMTGGPVPGHQIPGPPALPNYGGLLPQAGNSFMNFEPRPVMPPAMPFDHQIPLQGPPTEYSSAPVLYNNQPQQPCPAPISGPPGHYPAPVPSPQPVPAPTMVPPIVEPRAPYYSDYHSKPMHKPMPGPSVEQHDQRRRRSISPYPEHHRQKERLRTPEPPVISGPEIKEKTSLSSLLEASVSAKESTNQRVLYPGFNSEILRRCEHALRDLPPEDPRLKMKGRFFYNPKKELKIRSETCNHASNSILLMSDTKNLFWDVDQEREWADEEADKRAPLAAAKPKTCQKYSQTTTAETVSASVQATTTSQDVGVQVNLIDFPKEERRTVLDRLDWTARETYDYSNKPRETEDLRWSLSNSQRKVVVRGNSPGRMMDERLERERLEHMERERVERERQHMMDPPVIPSMDLGSRSMMMNNVGREQFLDYVQRSGEPMREPMHERLGGRPAVYSPEYRHREDYSRSRRSRSRSYERNPMLLEDHGDEVQIVEEFGEPNSDWGDSRGVGGNRGKIGQRGKFPNSRPSRGRGGFRGNRF